MTARLQAIVRHPVKAIGREHLDRVRLSPGAVLPWDRAFAVAHDAARIEGRSPGWAQKMNFLRGVSGPDLMAVTATLDEAGPTITLRHPARDPIALRPGDAADEAAFLDWLVPLWPTDAPRPAALVHTPGVPLTDVPERWVSVHSTASLAELGHALGTSDLSAERFRGNLWIEGVPAWSEFDWIGRRIRIGDAVLQVRERITRCKATMANPATGVRDADTLGALERGWGHTDFGVYAVVVSGGEIAVGDPVEVPS